MTIPMEEKENGLARRVDELRANILSRDMAVLAGNTGAALSDGRFQLRVWGEAVVISRRDFVAIHLENGSPCDDLTQAMLAHYFYTSNGTPVANEWIAFRELPDGQFYATAFQGYTGNKLARLFESNVPAFAAAAREIGGQALPLGDAAFSFQALPRVPIAIVCWLGDEDFPSSYRVLFDKAVTHHLPTDGCAILGSMLTSKLSRAMAQAAAA